MNSKYSLYFFSLLLIITTTVSAVTTSFFSPWSRNVKIWRGLATHFVTSCLIGAAHNKQQKKYNFAIEKVQGDTIKALAKVPARDLKRRKHLYALEEYDILNLRMQKTKCACAAPLLNMLSSRLLVNKIAFNSPQPSCMWREWAAAAAGHITGYSISKYMAQNS